jgi:hypothetical protein
MADMRQYRFRARVTLDAAAREGAARGLTSRMRALTAHDCCLLQPFCYRVYLPAVISPDRELPLQPGRRVVVAIALADGEADALFAPGQRFTVWADAVVGRTIRPEGLVGYGVICGRDEAKAGRMTIDEASHAMRHSFCACSASTTALDGTDQVPRCARA